MVLEATKQITLYHQPSVKKTFTSGIALHLHSFYSGAERIFETIARDVDGYIPSSDSWHEDLLRQMSNQIPGKRGAVVNEQTWGELNEFRRFRHVVRSNYAHKLNPERVLELASQLPQCYQHLEQDIRQFCEFLD